MISLSKEQLNNKWWHRLSKVLFFISIIIILLITIIACVSRSFELNPNKKDIIITENLYDFTKKSDEKISNTIPLFLDLPNKLGCIDSETIGVGYISDYQLLKGVCSSDLKKNLDLVVKKMKKEQPSLSEGLDKEFFEKILSEDKVQRMCFISSNDVDCTQSKIVKYKIKPIVYFFECLKIIGISIVAIVIWSIVCFGIYKALLYIIYGGKNN